MANRPYFGSPAAAGRLLIGLLAAALAGFGGCGGEPFAMVPVSGRVTYADGALIPGQQIVVRFIPKQTIRSGKDAAPAAIGEVDPKTGTFSGVTSHAYLDGAVRGPHKVTVVALQMGADGIMTPTQAVPERYQNAATTPLEWDAGRDTPPAKFKIDKGR